MKRLKTILICVGLSLSATVLTGCWADDELPVAEDPATPAPVLNLTQDGTVHAFAFNGYEPLAAKPVNVSYFIPASGDPAQMPILFIFPGEERDADSHVRLFTDWANANGVMLFGLSFSTAYYSTTTEYILGGMNTRQSAVGLLPSEQWNFNYVETLFEAITSSLSGSQTTYDIWGHSAGAQYVHRFVTFMPQAHVRKAVACNSGWYSVPDLAVEFPYGLGQVSEANTGMQQTALARQLSVCIGQNDTSTDGLNDNTGSVAQGQNRNERGRYYYNRAQQIAQQSGYSFRWTLREVANTAHDATGMARGTMDLLLP